MKYFIKYTFMYRSIHKGYLAARAIINMRKNLGI